MVVRRLVAALALMPALVACSDQDTGGPDADPSEPTSSATVEPTPTESPALPSAPGAAVRNWFAVYNDAVISNDSAELRRASAGRCVTCQGFIDVIEQRAANGGAVQRSPWVITDFEKVAGTGDDALFLVNVHEPGGTAVPSAGAQPTEFPAADSQYQVQVRRRGEVWIVFRVGQVA